MRLLKAWRLICLLFVRRVNHGDVIPPGYGVAWALYSANAAVVMPIPLNLLFGPLRSAWVWAKCEAYRKWELKEEAESQ